MTDDVNKKLETLIDSRFRSVKELIEVVVDKVSKLGMFQSVVTDQVRAIKDQQSVMNGKLDQLQETLDSHTASLIEIENTLKAYADMYKINGDHIKRINKRTSKIEKHLKIEPPQELLVPEF